MPSAAISAVQVDHIAGIFPLGRQQCGAPECPHQTLQKLLLSNKLRSQLIADALPASLLCVLHRCSGLLRLSGRIQQAVICHFTGQLGGFLLQKILHFTHLAAHFVHRSLCPGLFRSFTRPAAVAKEIIE